MHPNINFDNFMKFLVWLQGCLGIFFMYKCLSYKDTSIALCIVAGITIVLLVVIAAMSLTSSLNEFFYDIADLDKSIVDLNNTIKSRGV